MQHCTTGRVPPMQHKGCHPPHLSLNRMCFVSFSANQTDFLRGISQKSGDNIKVCDWLHICKRKERVQLSSFRSLLILFVLKAVSLTQPPALFQSVRIRRVTWEEDNQLLPESKVSKPDFVSCTYYAANADAMSTLGIYQCKKGTELPPCTFKDPFADGSWESS